MSKCCPSSSSNSGSIFFTSGGIKQVKVKGTVNVKVKVKGTVNVKVKVKGTVNVKVKVKGMVNVKLKVKVKVVKVKGKDDVFINLKH